MYPSDTISSLQTVHPFDALKKEDLEKIEKSLNIAYYPSDTILLAPPTLPSHLLIIIKGGVEAKDSEKESDYFGPQDLLFGHEILQERVEKTYRVIEELLCYELDKDLFLHLVKTDERFHHFFLKDLAARLNAMRQHRQQEMLNQFLSARVDEIYLHPPFFVQGSTPAVEAIKAMKKEGATAILVQHHNTVGIVTDKDLKDRLLAEERPYHTPIAQIATFDLITIQKSDFLLNALLAMTRHNIKRLIVMQKGDIVGLLEQIDLLSHLSNNTYLLTTRIERAKDIEDLKKIGDGLLSTIRSMQSKGMKARYIAKIVTEINDKIIQKLFSLLFPEAWHQNMALIVMGSEGRKEQIIRTDQDNALILKEAFHPPELEQKVQIFSQALENMGFPECPGGIMVKNPQWRKGIQTYKEKISGWIETPTQEAMMHLAILLDARTIAGNQRMCEELKTYLFDRFDDHPTALAMFASAIEQFDIPLGWFDILVRDEIDLKKGGIFILMHGIRALALQYKITETSTIERIKSLNDKEVFDRTFASELIEAFDTLSSILLETKLQAIATGKKPKNSIDIRQLGKIERDMLKDSLQIVKKFRRFAAYHFKLNIIG